MQTSLSTKVTINGEFRTARGRLERLSSQSLFVADEPVLPQGWKVRRGDCQLRGAVGKGQVPRAGQVGQGALQEKSARYTTADGLVYEGEFAHDSE